MRSRRVRVFVVPTPGLAPVLPSVLRALADGGHTLVNDPARPPPTPGLSQAERQAFVTDVDRMLEAEMLLADVSEESFAAGWCASWFLAKGRLVVLTCRGERRSALHAFVSGNPSPWQRLVWYERHADLETGLRRLLGGEA